MGPIKSIVFSGMVLVVLLLGCFTAPSVSAQPWEFILAESNDLPDGEQYGTVSLDYIYDGDKRGVRITVTANEDVLVPCSNFGIQKFAFNTTIINPETDLVVTLPESWTVQFGRFNISEFGRFHITATGEGFSRVNPLVIDIYHLTDSLSYTDFTVGNRDNQFFSLHIADYIYNNSSACLSAYFAPEGNPTTSTSSVLTTSTSSVLTTTTSSVLTTTTTTTQKPTTTSTSKPTTSTSSVLTTSTSSVLTTTTSSVPTTTSSVPTTTSSVLTTSTTTSQPTSTTTSQPTSTSSVLTTSTTSSALTTTTSTIAPCIGEIALGRECPGEEIDDPAYNRPGRRGLALTCNDVVDFTVCSDCDPFDPTCLEWTITPDNPSLTILQIDDCCWRLVITDTCDLLEDIIEFEVEVTDTCNGWSDSVVVELGKVLIDISETATKHVTQSFEVPVKLINPDHHVRALSTDICECDGGDSMQCIGCVIDPLRAFDFTCSATEQADGCCRVVLYSVDPSALIWQGSGPVFNILYSHAGEVDDCVCLRPLNRQVSDQFNEQLCACQSPGEVCFKSCGDIYPQDCVGGPCGDAGCGDGVVDLFDVMEAVDIILGLQTGTDCQLERANVPNGIPPYCGDPSGDPNCLRDTDLDMLDVLVITDMAQGRTNCCEYCLLK